MADQPTNQPRYYAGVGSRSTPEVTLQLMTNMAVYLGSHGFILRSGHADGADQAFENGAALTGPPGRAPMEIYLPWRGFNGSFSSPNNRQHIVPTFTPELVGLAGSYHPNWAACGIPARKLHSRNVCQVLGEDMQTPSEFVVCWTPSGNGEGGTGQAIRIARGHHIPVFDLGSKTGENDFVDYLQTHLKTGENPGANPNAEPTQSISGERA